MRYELPIVEQRVKPHQVTALHMMAALAFVGAGALMSLFYPPTKNLGTGLWIFGLLLIIVTISLNKWVLQATVNLVLRILELVILLALTIYAVLNHWSPPAVMFGVLSAAIVYAIWWEKQMQGDMKVIVDKNGIKLPATSRRKFVNWQDAEQVIIRFGVLTIDCYDNRLYQWTLGNIDINNDMFEQYCIDQIEDGKTKRDKNDW